MSEIFDHESFEYWIGSKTNNEFLKWWYDNNQFEGKYGYLAGGPASAAWFQQQQKIDRLQSENDQLSKLCERMAKLVDSYMWTDDRPDLHECLEIYKAFKNGKT